MYGALLQHAVFDVRKCVYTALAIALGILYAVCYLHKAS
jgi:hypothetical protein